MISVNDSERRYYTQQLMQGTFVQSLVDATLQRNQPRAWDGFIHSSKLDWNSHPETQFKAHLSPGHSPIELARYAKCGEIYHDALQHSIDRLFKPENSYPEFKMQVPDICFQGTCDRLQMNTPVGNILFEWKTTNSFSKDKQGGDRIWNRMYKDKHIGDAITISPWWDENSSEIKKRLYIKENVLTAKSGHLTQMFTYAWILMQYYRVPVQYAVLGYVRRESFQVEEFVYPIENSMELVQKAHNNFYEVLRCRNEYLQRMNGSR